MMVIMNSKGEYARVGESHTHTGTKNSLKWGGLHSATLFNDIISERDYKNIFQELVKGIFIPASVTRVVTLLKHSEDQST